MPDEPKLHIDDDWKSEAQREKQRLAQEVETTPPGHGEAGPMPPADFRGLVSMLAMQAMVGLSGLRDPSGAVIPPNYEAAKHHIDLLDVLEKKSKGNLSDEETRALATTLYQLRMAYVETITARTEAARGGDAV